MTKMYGEIQKGFEDVYKEMHQGFKEVYKEMSQGFEKVNLELQEVKNTVIRIENDHGQKLSALFDGYKQNSNKLGRMEAEISKHEEFIIKRIK